MRRIRALASLVPLLAAGAALGARPAAAVSPCAATVSVSLNGGAVTCSLAAGTDVAQNIALTGSSTAERVLDVRAATDGGNDFFACLWGNEDTTHYARSSHVEGSTIQRVALADPYWGKYQLELMSLQPGANVGNVAGLACSNLQTLLGTAQAYTLTVSYTTEAATPASNGFAFSTRNLPAATTTSLGGTPGAGEPTIAVDAAHGNKVFISAPVGVPSGAGCAVTLNPTGPCLGDDLWYSLDGGKSFTQCNTGGLTGGGDSHLAINGVGDVFGADLAATHVWTEKLPAGGNPNPTASACGFQLTQPTDFEADRQWIGTYGSSTVRVGYHDLATGTPINCESTDDGQTYPVCVPELDPTNAPLVADAAGNTVIGPQVFDSKGNDYEVFMTSTAPDNLATGGSGSEHNIYVAVSPDGTSWTDYPVHQSTPYNTTGTKNVDQLFAVLAIDRADNLYAVWGEGDTCAAWNSVCPANVYLASSTDHGRHWSAPVRVNSGATTSNVLPWIAAGDDGRVDVVWVGSTSSKNPSGDVTADWRIYMAQSLNAHSSSPTFKESVVSPYPVRRGQICESGLNCSFNGDDGRILLDFISISLDSSCRARIAYANAGPDPESATIGTAFAPFTDYAEQTSGPTVCVAAAAKPSPFTTGSGFSTAGVLTGFAVAASGAMVLALAGLAWRRWQD